MNRLLWIVVNGALIAAAYGVTLWVLNQVPARTPANADEGRPKTVSSREPEKRSGTTDALDDEDLTPAVTAADLDVLWRETLFRPDRSEELKIEPGEEQREQDQSVNLELIGLARIGERAIAVIVEHRAAARRPVRPTVRASSRSLPRPPDDSDPSAGGAEAPIRHVYEVGDEVARSGYTVNDIRIEDEEVVIVRGNEERVLALDKSDDQSSARLQTAAAAAEVVKRTEKAGRQAEDTAAKDAADAGEPPPPPPPPPAAAAAAGNGQTAAEVRKAVTEMTREERLERARLLRERILQRRSQNNDD